MPYTILTIIGARPQFVKASVVSRALKKIAGIKEIVLHTGQHFDANMSDIFFDQLQIPRPDVSLDIHGGAHGEMTGRMLIEIEKAIIAHRPSRVLVYGDTNSTLAGALAAAKLHVPVAHIEAGLRSYNRKMPEEINRVLTDEISDILFCPTDAAVHNLMQEGFAQKTASILKVGDVMQDASMLFAEQAVKPKAALPDDFGLVTLHRAENTDDKDRLASIVAGLNECHHNIAPLVLPLHPRTKQKLADYGLCLDVCVIDPVGYLEMLWLLSHCQMVMTDSGGVQKEAYFFNKSCVTLRDETEWVELVNNGVNELVGADKNKIIAAAQRAYGSVVTDDHALYGGGTASDQIAKRLALEIHDAI